MNLLAARTGGRLPRVSRLMALAIRLDQLTRERHHVLLAFPRFGFGDEALALAVRMRFNNWLADS